MNQLRLAWARRLFSINIPQAETTFRVGCLLFPYNFQPRALLQNVSGDSAGSRARSRDDLARQSDLISLGVPSADPFSSRLNKPPTRARARERLIIVEFRGFRRARSPQGMLRECSDSAHRLHSKKPLPWRVTGASVARHVERPWVRSKNVYIAEPAPELQPMCCE